MNTKKLYLYRLASMFLPDSKCYGLKNSLLRWAGAKIGNNVRIYSSTRIQGTGGLEIGNDVHIGAECFIVPVAPSKIEIGSSVDIAPRVTILTGTHKIDEKGSHIGGEGESRSVSIGIGCWLCANCTILPGSKIANHSVVAAGAVVNKIYKMEKCLLAGVPAKVLKNYKEQ